jgi:hypothetical protein
LVENDADVRAHAVEGWEYLGTWLTVRGFGTYQAETRWEIGEYADLGSGFGGNVSQRPMGEFFEYVDRGRPAEAALMKSVNNGQILAGS